MRIVPNFGQICSASVAQLGHGQQQADPVHTVQTIVGDPVYLPCKRYAVVEFASGIVLPTDQGTGGGHMKILLAGCLALTLAGCVNGYSRFYRPFNGVSPELVASRRAAPPSGSPLLDHVGSMDKSILQAYMAQGFMPIGYSSFSGPAGQSEGGAVSEGVQLGADLVVVVNPTYQGTRSAVIPITTPTSSTSYTTGSATAYGPGGITNAYGSATTTTYGTRTNYIPIAIERDSYGAVYFVKVKSYLGALVQPLPTEMQQELQTNRGVVVANIIRGTPAFESDILIGDVLLSIDSVPLDGPEQYSQVIKDKSGQSVAIKIYRHGTYLVKTVKLN